MSAHAGNPAQAASGPATGIAEAMALRTTPLGLAVQLAVLGGDLPGFDNGDRARLRRIAYALGPTQQDHKEALRLAREAVRIRADTAAMRSRPEAVLLEAVLWLLMQPEGEAERDA